MAISEELQAHLSSGLTTLARCWQIVRKDGHILGFTDHDCDLYFLDTEFRAGTGMTALALEQATGLSVDNTEGMGALSDDAITERDIAAGRFDGAKVTAWLVNWSDVDERHIIFRGSIGEVQRGNGAFRAELRGLTEDLNKPMGRVFQKPCTAVLGDADCGFNLDAAGYSDTRLAETVADRRVFQFADPGDFAEGWFSRGRLTVLSGAAAGVQAPIKTDRIIQGVREVALWDALPEDVAQGDQLRLEAGCDKRFETCRLKFLNHLNFRGFPDLPGDEWITLPPRNDGTNDGGSLRG
jgi:uncharacterized phage protein (TIGR02218 family)